MAEQTQALRLADEFDDGEWIAHTSQWREEAAAELRRLDQHERAHNEWSEKTAWVQDTAQPHELGMHRADVLKQRIEKLEAVNAQLLEALEKAVKLNSFREFNDHIPAMKAAIKAAKGEA